MSKKKVYIKLFGLGLLSVAAIIGVALVFFSVTNMALIIACIVVGIIGLILISSPDVWTSMIAVFVWGS